MNQTTAWKFGRQTALLLALLLGCAAPASAQIFADDDAAPYADWQTGTNCGFGFQPWVQVQTGSGSADYTGFFLNNTGDAVASTNGQAWGIYANGASGTNAAEAFRAFSNSLPVNATFKIRWHNLGIGNSTANVGGFNLRNGNSTNLMDAATFLNDGTRFALYYLGGISDNFSIYDGNGVNQIPLGFSSNPFLVEFTLLPGDTYNLTIKNADGSVVLYNASAQPLAGSGAIDSAALYAFQTTGNQVFNDMEIFYSPPQILNLSPANGSIYVTASGNQLSFDVTSFASTVFSNQIQLALNGVVQTGDAWTVFGGGTSSNHVVLNTALQDNTVYSGIIIAADADGNSTTNNFTFNTWLPGPENIFVEAEDYNYSGGLWIDNLANPQPNQVYGQYDLLGSNGVDYLEYDLTGTNAPNAYRAGDLPQVEAATDADHNNFANNGFQDYDLGYNQNGEWEDYTRNLSNVTYAVYARMAGFGGNPVMLMERTASPEVSSADQPRAALGTFVCPQTGGVQNYTFVPLKDFFSRPVLVNFPDTNTFRLADIGSDGSYNLNYLVLVALTNTATLRPYLASGFPYPGADGVGPDQLVSFTIANRQTSVSSVRLFLNSAEVTSGIVLSNNSAGTIVSYQPAPLMPPGTNTLQVVFSDGAVSQTNSWQFTVASLAVIPPSFALPLNGNYSRGFAGQIAKAPDDATNIDFPVTIARALAQLAGTLTNSQTGQPYTNLAAGPNGDGSYIETNTINYDITGLPTGSWTFGTKTNFPYLPASGTNNFIALKADIYLQLSAGVYTFAVRSDDGFELTAGASPGDTNMILGIFDGGRGNDTPTTFDFIVETNGLYPMRLVYDQGEFGGNIEFYSINRTNGTPVLINDPANSDSVPAYYVAAGPVMLGIQTSGGNVVLTWSNPAFSLQAAPEVTGTYTNVSGATSPYTTAIIGSQRFFRLVR